jgi:adenosylcobinamide kinase/adenosylcobinamide-phosphate guanylyltransferase
MGLRLGLSKRERRSLLRSADSIPLGGFGETSDKKTANERNELVFSSAPLLQFAIFIASFTINSRQVRPVFVFISGAARSGKSSWAEDRALSLSRANPGSPLVYLATARVQDQEMRARVLRHRAMRKNKGFETLEREVDVASAVPSLSPDSTVLLECLGTLLANEMFGKEKFQGEEKIYGELLLLRAKTTNLLIVSDDIFSDGTTYDEATENYLRVLGALHVKLAREADFAIECVCGLTREAL